MFDFGFWEIAIIGIITLIVVGPEKMPSLARKAGLFIGKLKNFINKVKSDINEDLKVDEIKEDLKIDEIIEEISIKDSISDLSKSLDDDK